MLGTPNLDTDNKLDQHTLFVSVLGGKFEEHMTHNSSLDRFITAQAEVIGDALGELQAGQKRGHWMWLIFPQLRSLGISAASQHYGIADLAEAQAYLEHPLLRIRLVACTEAVLAVQGRTLHQIFGSPDDMKFRSSMTLFGIAADRGPHVFQMALEQICRGEADARTVAIIAK